MMVHMPKKVGVRMEGGKRSPEHLGVNGKAIVFILHYLSLDSKSICKVAQQTSKSVYVLPYMRVYALCGCLCIFSLPSCLITFCLYYLYLSGTLYCYSQISDRDEC